MQTVYHDVDLSLHPGHMDSELTRRWDKGQNLS